MSMPLDDLLPTSDAAFEPVCSAEYFNTGTPFWEFADICKWKPPLDEASAIDAFKMGYYAALFESALKSGRAFWFPIGNMPASMFLKRAERFGRSCELIPSDSYRSVKVSGHSGSHNHVAEIVE